MGVGAGLYNTCTMSSIKSSRSLSHLLMSSCNLLHAIRKVNKCTDIGNRMATIDIGQIVRVLCPFLGGAGFPSNTMWPGPRRISSGSLIHPAVWPQQTWAEFRKLVAVPLWGELGPYLTQCGRAEAYLHAIFHQTDRTDSTDRQDNGPIARKTKNTIVSK